MGTMCVEIAHRFFQAPGGSSSGMANIRSTNAAIAWAFLACSSAEIGRTRPVASLQGTRFTDGALGNFGDAVSVERLAPVCSSNFSISCVSNAAISRPH